MVEWLFTVFPLLHTVLHPLVYRFKLHLRPKALPSSHIRDDDIPPLPHNKTIVDVFADYLRYLFKCGRKYIQETHPEESGVAFWESVENQIHFVLSHPNGWEGAQQSQMRRAAVLAGLVPDGPDSHTRLQFVTEGEASLHFCVENKASATAITVLCLFPAVGIC